MILPSLVVHFNFTTKANVILYLYNYILMGNKKNSVFGLLLITCVLFASTAAAWNVTTRVVDLQGVVESIFCGYGHCKDNQQCQANRKYIASLQESGFYNISNQPISNNKYNINSITYQSIEKQGYFEWQNKAKNGNRKMSGLLVLPETKGPIRGIVISFHGTLFSKNEAPSIQHNFNVKYQASGAIFASQNLAVLFPDYPGFGTDAHNAHPYAVYPQQNIVAATYLLNEAVHILNEKYGKYGLISESNPLPLMSTGYSEGGAYGVWFGACNTPSISQQRKFKHCTIASLSKAYKIVGISGSAGAYDAEVSNSFMLNTVNGAGQNYFKIGRQSMTNAAIPGFSILSVFAFVTYNPKPFNLSLAVLPSFYNMECAEDVSSSVGSCTIQNHPHMTIEQALFLDDSSFKAISGAIMWSAISKKNNGRTFLSASTYSNGTNNSFLSLVNEKNLFTNEFYQTCNDSSIVTYGDDTIFPVFIYSLNQDSMVTPRHSENFIKNNKNGRVQNFFLNSTVFKTCDDPEGSAGYVKTDHIGGYAVSQVFVLNFFEQVLKKVKASSEEL